MEGHLEIPPELEHPFEDDDVSGLSHILVAAIQETKDRISQIEYIFCRQIYPNFQSRSKSLQKAYSEAAKASEDAWARKESDLILKLEKLELEKQQALERNAALLLEKAAATKEQEENTSLHLTKIRSLERRAHELEREVAEKSEELDEGMKLQKKLIQIVQTKTAAVVNNGKLLQQREENASLLASQVKRLEKEVDELRESVANKTGEVNDGVGLREDLVRKIELQGSKLAEIENEKKLLQEEFQKKCEEVEEGRQLLKRFHQYADLTDLNILENEQQVEEHGEAAKPLLAKLKGSQERGIEPQVDLAGRESDMSRGKEAYEKLLARIESKNSQLLSEKRRVKDLIASYKRLKSQYTFLCRKKGLTLNEENRVATIKVGWESDALRHDQNSLLDLETEIPDTCAAASDANEAGNEITIHENLKDDKGNILMQSSSSQSPSSYISPFEQRLANEKNSQLAGAKRSASDWRDTRSRLCQDGPDPHDNFLDTPFEHIKGKLKASKEVHDLPGPVPKNKHYEFSDDETQDMNLDNQWKHDRSVDNQREQRNPAPRPGMGGFKFVEPVRKKAERENLKGVECKQCKKFYDAVLPNGGKGLDGNKQEIRCEHHDGVSRHRYRYVPPLTPEGFWNIGFDTETN